MNRSETITDEYRFSILRKRVGEGLILNAFRRLRRAEIEPILIKGWAAARNYPERVPRFFGDIDLAVSAPDFEKAQRVIQAENISGIDLHCELRQLDTLDWNRLMDDSEVVELDGEGIRILCAEDHLRVLVMHWLTDGGENQARLWDIVYAVRNRPSNFDWSRCLDVVGPTRRGWIISTIGIANKYLGLELDDLPFAEEARDIPSWITKSLEKEWASNLPLLPLHTQLKSPVSLITQIRKRIPPNPIQATINCEGDFSDASRAGYQIRDIFQRLKPSVHRVWLVLIGKSPHQ